MSARIQAILVLGMHRSGTSALTGVLHKLGVPVGNNLIPANPKVNPKGFWEDASINELNEEVLRSLGSYWFDAISLPDNWWLQKDLEPLRERFKAIVNNQFINQDTWAMKDPRLCRVLPLWMPLLVHMNREPNAVLILRHPIEIACSLHERDGIQLHHALTLWMRYVLESEKNSRGLPRVFITYQALLNNWESTLTRIGDSLALNFKFNNENKNEIERFLERQLRHHTVDDIPDNAFAQLANTIYEEISVGNINNLDLYHRKLEDLITQFKPWLIEANLSMDEKLRYKLQASKLTECNLVMKQEVERIKSSLSWRITAPLRAIKNFCFKPSQRKLD